MLNIKDKTSLSAELEAKTISSEILTKNFDTITKADGGIKKLRELILQLAVQGKLVPQNPDDEPASVLLEKIKEEKQNLIKTGKIKKQKPLPPVDEDEIPYVLPEGWVWTRVGEAIHHISNGYSGKQDKNISNIQITRIETISNEFVDLSKIGYVHNVSNTDMEKYLLKNGDILFSHINSDKHLGKTAIYELDQKLYHGTNLLLIRTLHKHIYPIYLNIAFKQLRTSGYFISIAQNAINQSSINQQKLKNSLIPLPPLAEQHRIVERVDALMKLCDDLESRQKSESENRRLLLLSVLRNLEDTGSEEESKEAWDILSGRFEDLINSAEDIKELRKTILQLAVQGRLVSQNPDDEPSSVLLEKIKEEKQNLIKTGQIKKQKALSPIDEDEVPYELPEGWIWTRFDGAFFSSSGTTPTRTIHSYFEQGTENWIKTTDLNNDIVLTCEEKITKEAIKDFNLKYYPIGTVCIAMYGGAGTIGKSGILGVKSTLNQSVCAIYPSNYVSPKYLHTYVKAIRKEWMNYASGLRKAPNINGKIIKNMKIPLPPLAEQQRIVERVDCLMKLCDELEERVVAREEAAERLLSSVCAGICG